MILVLPAYQPDERLVDVVAEVTHAAPDWTVLVVDDGSGSAYTPIFVRAVFMGATVITHSANRGKGAALKTAFAWVERNAPGESVVCADSDGQHLVHDIVRVASSVRPGAMVLGGRRFTGRVPLRSRVGNTITRHVFRALSGISVYDTQTGLRAYPFELLPWLRTVPGDRFEYEFQALLRAPQAGVGIVEVEIMTVYGSEPRSSHFRSVRDSWRIYAPLLAQARPRP